ncbi:thiamine pyrophosphate-dependent enzyme [Halomonas sp.]|uniref:thiamine pyrophosphate-dependent enzyme n=1 Tax=Halomonas sp. TaxID=1486246 RepID=UPI0025C0F8E9|nr:thiamine pyrophosphate-dependent enzyme [Halomonas sp.]
MKEEPRDNYLASGHNACPGCGVSIAVRLILRASGNNVVVVSPTGCLETFTSPYGMSAWEVPWVHSLFENAPAVASGIRAALDYQGNKDTQVMVIGGDGATYDIGLGSLSGMLERNQNILYICYDNEAYMNTGIQRSSATPLGASTTTTPATASSYGEKLQKKDMIGIANSHNIEYVATATIAYPQDLMRKIKTGLSVNGAAYLHMLTPCPLGWGFESDETIAMSRLSVQTGFFPLVEYENGELIRVKKIIDLKPVNNYLRAQRRFKHLTTDENQDIKDKVCQVVRRNIKKYGLQENSNNDY